ncbi:MAG TPA: hypothetical protein VGG16_01920, partial [Streptosporangiaceae bacterium]
HRRQGGAAVVAWQPPHRPRLLIPVRSARARSCGPAALRVLAGGQQPHRRQCQGRGEDQQHHHDGELEQGEPVMRLVRDPVRVAVLGDPASLFIPGTV